MNAYDTSRAAITLRNFQLTRRHGRRIVCALLIVLASSLSARESSGDELIDLDRLSGANRPQDVIKKLQPLVGRTVRLRFTVRYVGGIRNIYFNSEKKGRENLPHNVVLTIPDDGRAKNGKDTWSAFKNAYESSDNIQTKDAFRDYVDGQTVEVTGKLTGGQGAVQSSESLDIPVASSQQEDRADAAPFRIRITDPSQLTILPTK